MTGQRGTAVKLILTALADHGSRIEQRGTDAWMAQCPADGHDDRTASLSVAQGDVGAVVCCQAGCDTKTAVLPALKLGFPDLFDQPRKARGPGAAADRWPSTTTPTSTASCCSSRFGTSRRTSR